MQPAPVFVPGESHGQRSQEGYSPWEYKESDTTEATFIFIQDHMLRGLPETNTGWEGTHPTASRLKRG